MDRLFWANEVVWKIRVVWQRAEILVLGLIR